MKLSNARQIDAFIKSIPAEIRAVLIYGPDRGLMRERARLIGGQIVADLNDPFNVSVLNGDDLKEMPGALSDEANAVSMMGGRRLVRIENAGDTVTVALKPYLDDPNPEALLIIEGGELGPRSSLRQLAEKTAAMAAIPCYVDAPESLGALIRAHLEEHGIRVSRDALTWLSQALAGDRQRIRGELDKLVTYMGEAKQVELEDACACCGDAGVLSMDDLAFSTGGGRPEQAIRTFTALLAEGMPVIAVLRTLQNHFRRLHHAQTLAARESDMRKVMNMVVPPVFFKQQDAFQAQMRLWRGDELLDILGRLADLEARCKQTGTPDETLTAQMILSISARRAGAGRTARR